jgi:triosephosphate isomerase
MDSFKKNGPLIINLKNYIETAGDNTLRIVKDAERVSEKLDVEIIISPPQPSLALIAKQTKLKVISQHIDLKSHGATTGFYVPEVIEKVGAIGSLINHSEHGIKTEEIKQLIEKLKEINLLSFVCVKTVGELKEILKFGPDFVAIEPPELIGTQKSISAEKPYLIQKSNDLIKQENYGAKLICGAGINKGEDIKMAVENGASGILVSSSVTRANNWYDKIFELASAF